MERSKCSLFTTHF